MPIIRQYVRASHEYRYAFANRKLSSGALASSWHGPYLSSDKSVAQYLVDMAGFPEESVRATRQTRDETVVEWPQT